MLQMLPLDTLVYIIYTVVADSPTSIHMCVRYRECGRVNRACAQAVRHAWRTIERTCAHRLRFLRSDRLPLHPTEDDVKHHPVDEVEHRPIGDVEGTNAVAAALAAVEFYVAHRSSGFREDTIIACRMLGTEWVDEDLVESARVFCDAATLLDFTDNDDVIEYILETLGMIKFSSTQSDREARWWKNFDPSSLTDLLSRPRHRGNAIRALGNVRKSVLVQHDSIFTSMCHMMTSVPRLPPIVHISAAWVLAAFVVVVKRNRARRMVVSGILEAQRIHETILETADEMEEMTNDAMFRMRTVLDVSSPNVRRDMRVHPCLPAFERRARRLGRHWTKVV